MQHLSDVYDSLGPQPIPYDEDIKTCLDSKHGHRYQDFVAFPAEHGYEIDREYRLLRIGVSHDPKFASGPGNLRCNKRSLNEHQFLQAWLFFGIIRCVVRNEKQLIENIELQEDEERLNTKRLRDALNDWSKYLLQLAGKRRNEAEMRCIEAVQMLTLARRVIIANLSDGKQRKEKSERHELLSLCLMVLGETLSAALALTMERCEIDIRGWHLDADGWGPPTYVLEKMKTLGWCLRLQEVLKGQFGRSATLLYVSLKIHSSQTTGSHIVEHHKKLKCTEHVCYLVEASFLGGPLPQASDKRVDENKFQYRSLHHESCKDLDNGNCQKLGPDKERLRQILAGSEPESEPRKVDFPLLRYREAGAKPVVEVQKWSDNSQAHFATISHVWAHGLGNEENNEIQQCQLKQIQQLVEKISRKEQLKQGNRPPLSQVSFFWLDTLAIPIEEPDDIPSAELRQKAIGSIYHVFDRADCSIIIDRNLLNEYAFEDRLSTTVKLLSSGWMKRLWTLQEAFVTKNLFLAMEKSEKYRNLDTLFKSDAPTNVMKDSLSTSIRLKLSQNLMEAQRQLRKQEAINIEKNDAIEDKPEPNLHRKNEQKKRWSMLIADAWKSTRYRDVGRLENETLALASLLGLPIPSKPVEKQKHSDKNDKNHAFRIKVRDEMMKEFWESVSKKTGAGCAIPTGMIFTPGERISLPGFRWAPRTWMVGKDESYPYPLSIPCYSETLVGEGLMVQYPGFIIHARSEEYGYILGMNKTRDENPGFMFPTSSGLHDWYLVEQLDKVESSATKQFIQDLLVKVDEAKVDEEKLPKLGVILSRPRPTEFPKEVALLVEIYQPDIQSHDSRKNELRAQAERLYCKIIRRLEISRVSILEKQVIQSSGHTHIQDKYKRFDVAIVGETLSDDQCWYVDGRDERVQSHDEDDADDQYFSADESQESQSPPPVTHGTNDGGTGSTWTLFNPPYLFGRGGNRPIDRR